MGGVLLGLVETMVAEATSSPDLSRRHRLRDPDRDPAPGRPGAVRAREHGEGVMAARLPARGQPRNPTAVLRVDGMPAVHPRAGGSRLDVLLA